MFYYRQPTSLRRGRLQPFTLSLKLMSSYQIYETHFTYSDLQNWIQGRHGFQVPGILWQNPSRKKMMESKEKIRCHFPLTSLISLVKVFINSKLVHCQKFSTGFLFLISCFSKPLHMVSQYYPPKYL